MIAIILLVIFVRNLIGVGVAFGILLIYFEVIWMESTHACVSVIMLGALRGVDEF